MNAVATSLIESLVRTSLWLVAAVLVAALVLRVARVASPAVHRAAWIAALAVGWTFLRWPLGVPWYEAEPRAEIAAVITTYEAAPPATDPLIELAPAAAVPAEATAPLEAVDAPLPTVEINPIEPIVPAGAVEVPTNTSAAAAGRFDWAVALLAIWSLVAAVIVVRWFVGYTRFVRQIARLSAADDRWSAAWATQVAAAGVRGRAGLRYTAEVGPLVCRVAGGYELLLPAKLWNELDEPERSAILRHELAHLVRGDLWKSLAARVLALPHWFNPAAWWAVRRFDEAAEWACDRAAAGEESPTSYAKALLRIGETAPARSAYGHAIRGRTLAARVRRLLTGAPAEDTSIKKTALAALGVCLAVAPLVKVELIAKQPSKQAAKPATTDATVDPVSQGLTRLQAQQVSSRDLKAEDDAAMAQTTGPNDAAQRPANGPTVSPYLDLLQESQAGPQPPQEVFQTLAEAAAALNRSNLDDAASADGAAGGSKKTADSAAAAAKEVAAAQQKIVAAAKRGFEATEAAFKAETITFEPVCIWSERRMEAEFESTASPQQKRTTIEAHLRRMRRWQAAIKVLHQQGVRGGEAERVATADYYVARAERRLAQLGSEGFTDRMIRKGYQPATARAQAPADQPVPAGKQNISNLRYDGQSFDYWRAQVEGELSVERRTQAIRALGAFGAAGMGRETIGPIIAAIADYSVSTLSNDPEGRLKEAAFMAVRRMPPGQAYDALAEALQTGNADQRLFAVNVLPNAVKDRKQALPLLLKAAHDDDVMVRVMARYSVAIIDPGSPPLVELVREALAGDNAADKAWALRVAGGSTGFNGGMGRTAMPISLMGPGAASAMVPGLAEVAPQLIELLQDDNQQGDTNQWSARAKAALEQIGPAAIPALEAAAENDDALAATAEEIIEEIRSQPERAPLGAGMGGGMNGGMGAGMGGGMNGGGMGGMGGGMGGGMF